MIIKGPTQSYTPEKIKARNEYKILVDDHAGKAAMNAQLTKRKQNVLLCGFCSDPREPYKTLGNLFLDSESLLYHCLHIDPSTLQKFFFVNCRVQNNRVAETSLQPDIVGTVNRRIGIGLPQNQSNGFPLLGERITKSKHHINTVKFGTPFLKILSTSGTDSEYESYLQKKEREAMSLKQEIDWKNLKIDVERQQYYSSILEKRKRELGSGAANQNEAREREKEREQALEAHKQTSKFGNAKMMEQALNINRDDKYANSTRQFLQSREKCVSFRIT